MLIPVNEALTVGAAQDLLAPLKLYEHLGRDGNMTAAAYSVVHRHDDRVIETPADKFISLEHRFRNLSAGKMCIRDSSGERVKASATLR